MRSLSLDSFYGIKVRPIVVLRAYTVFTARCTLVQSAVLRSHVVCLCVRLFVTSVDCDHIGCNSLKIISPPVNLGCSLFATQTSRVYSEISAKSGPNPVDLRIEDIRSQIMVTDSATVTMESL